MDAISRLSGDVAGLLAAILDVQSSGEQLVMFLNVQTGHFNSHAGGNNNDATVTTVHLAFVNGTVLCPSHNILTDVNDRCCCHPSVYCILSFTGFTVIFSLIVIVWLKLPFSGNLHVYPTTLLLYLAIYIYYICLWDFCLTIIELNGSLWHSQHYKNYI